MRMQTIFVMITRHFVIVFLSLIWGITALKDVSINIPTAAKIRDTITLQCFFDLEGELLYTLKWYKGSKEFFRYLPKELPNTRTFSLPGITIDINKSNHTHLVLTNVQPETTGKYKCEVSTDAPNFYTLMAMKYLYVVDVPQEEPVLMLEKDLVEIGHILKGNCTSPPSYPPANITWYLNGKRINESSKRTQYPDHMKIIPASAKRVPQVTFSTIELEMDERVFSYGKVRFTCAANIFDLYKKEKEIIVDEDRPKPRPSSVLGNRDTSTGFKLRSTSTLFGSLLVILNVFSR